MIDNTPEPYPIQPVEEGKRSKAFRFLADVLETLLLSAILFFGINAISARIRVDGQSMEPTLHTGEYVIVNKLAYKFGAPAIGDVIIFRYPRNPQQEYIKRVIGLPNDRVEIRDGQVWVNGQLLDEPYIASAPNYQANWVVPEKSLFVLGDNRNNSSDSHAWGPVPLEYVVGKAIVVYWPPQRWGLIDHLDTAIAAP
ncbi:MAG: signal peptidase I [Anaerolineales bacterium]|nr:signal peptidase I [Anaerolineales bacterium]